MQAEDEAAPAPAPEGAEGAPPAAAAAEAEGAPEGAAPPAAEGEGGPPPAEAGPPAPEAEGGAPPPPEGAEDPNAAQQWRPPPGAVPYYAPPPPGYPGGPPAGQYPPPPTGWRPPPGAVPYYPPPGQPYPPPPPGYGMYGQPPPHGYSYPPPHGYGYDPSVLGGKKSSPKKKGTLSKGGKQKTMAEIMERKARKNQQSRARASRLRERIAEIQKKPEDARTEDDLKVLEIFEDRRRRKNERSRDRAIEKKQEIERILAKPEKRRTKSERACLDIAMKAKSRKNEGDRIRRERIKMMGLKGKGISVSVRGRPRRTLGPDGQPIPYDSSIPYAPGMDPNQVPMSPVPLHSPGPNFGSPGMMYAPSPGHQGSQPQGGYPPQGYPQQGYPPAQSAPVDGSAAPRQLPMGQGGAPGGSVQEERHPDGSLTISIGGADGKPAAEGGEAAPPAPEGEGEAAPAPAASSAEEGSSEV